MAAVPAAEQREEAAHGLEVEAEEEARIKREYATTIDVLIEAVGCRPRRLLSCLSQAVPMTDAELACRAMTHDQLVQLATVEGLSREERAWIDKAKSMTEEQLAAARAEVHMPGA